jgi:hypothetical protein
MAEAHNLKAPSGTACCKVDIMADKNGGLIRLLGVEMGLPDAVGRSCMALAWGAWRLHMGRLHGACMGRMHGGHGGGGPSGFWEWRWGSEIDGDARRGGWHTLNPKPRTPAERMHARAHPHTHPHALSLTHTHTDRHAALPALCRDRRGWPAAQAVCGGVTKGGSPPL